MYYPDMIPGPDAEDAPDCHKCGVLSMESMMIMPRATHNKEMPVVFLY